MQTNIATEQYVENFVIKTSR